MGEKVRMEINFLKNLFWQSIMRGDCDADGNISQKEAEGILEDSKMVSALECIGIDLCDFVDQLENTFEKKSHVHYEEFLDSVVQLRSNNNCTVRDMLVLRRTLRSDLRQLHHNLMQAIGMKTNRNK